MIYTKIVEIICPYCNKKIEHSLTLRSDGHESIYTCPYRSCKKIYVLTYNTQIIYKTYKLVGAEIERVAKE